MASYNDPDDWFDRSQIEYGNGGGQQSIRDSLKATNGSVYRTEPVVNSIAASIASLPDRAGKSAVDRLLAVRFPYGNQDGVPEDKKATNNLIESLNATNQQVFSPQVGLAALRARLDAQDKAIAAIAATLAAIAAKVGLPNQ